MVFNNTKKIRVAINGCGRIGRAFLKLAERNENVEVVAVNDLADLDNIVYLLKYDTVYRKSVFDISSKEDSLSIIVDGKEI